MVHDDIAQRLRDGLRNRTLFFASKFVKEARKARMSGKSPVTVLSSALPYHHIIVGYLCLQYLERQSEETYNELLILQGVTKAELCQWEKDYAAHDKSCHGAKETEMKVGGGWLEASVRSFNGLERRRLEFERGDLCDITYTCIESWIYTSVEESLIRLFASWQDEKEREESNTFRLLLHLHKHRSAVSQYLSSRPYLEEPHKDQYMMLVAESVKNFAATVSEQPFLAITNFCEEGKHYPLVCIWESVMFKVIFLHLLDGFQEAVLKAIVKAVKTRSRTKIEKAISE